jgi:hypothetical protein
MTPQPTVSLSLSHLSLSLPLITRIADSSFFACSPVLLDSALLAGAVFGLFAISVLTKIRFDFRKLLEVGLCTLHSFDP